MVEWEFVLMLDGEAFTSIPDSLEKGGNNYSVISLA